MLARYSVTGTTQIMDKEKQEQWNDATLQILESLHKAIDGLHYQNSILKQMLDIMDNRLNRLEKSGSKIESDSAAAPAQGL